MKDKDSILLLPISGCWTCPYRDECPDAMMDVADMCGMNNRKESL